MLISILCYAFECRYYRHSLSIMSSRAKRTEEGSSSAPPPKKVKGNASAQTRTIFPERNLAMATPEGSLASPALNILRECVTSEGIRELACANDDYNETLVKEFYDSFPGGIVAHAKEVELKVRGKRIVLNRELIESVLSLPHVSDEDEESFFATIGAMPTSGLHVTTYINPRALTAQSSSSLQCGRMSAEYRALWLFIRCNLNPTSQKSEVPFESCKLSIQMRRGERPIPYARYILSSILGSAVRGRLFFPCVVTRICRHFRVPEKRTDQVMNEIGVLDERIFARSETQVERSQIGAPPPQPSHTQGEAAPGSSYSIPFDPSLVDPNTHAMVQHYHSLTMGRLDTMEELIRQIAAMMPQRGHGGVEESGPGEDI